MGIHWVLRKHDSLLLDNQTSIFNITMRMYSQMEDYDNEYEIILELVTWKKYQIDKLETESGVLQHMITSFAKISQLVVAF
jgi:hypothetical protein